jgi:hypothetical protein
MRKLIFIGLIVCLFSACSDDKPTKTIGDDNEIVLTVYENGWYGCQLPHTTNPFTTTTPSIVLEVIRTIELEFQMECVEILTLATGASSGTNYLMVKLGKKPTEKKFE